MAHSATKHKISALILIEYIGTNPLLLSGVNSSAHSDAKSFSNSFITADHSSALVLQVLARAGSPNVSQRHACSFQSCMSRRSFSISSWVFIMLIRNFRSDLVQSIPTLPPASTRRIHFSPPNSLQGCADTAEGSAKKLACHPVFIIAGQTSDSAPCLQGLVRISQAKSLSS